VKKKTPIIKKSFSLLEIIFVIIILSIGAVMTLSKSQISKLNLATQKIILYLNYTRYISHIDNKFDIKDEEWEKKRWTLKFKNCNEKIGGLYYNVYNDTSGGTAHYKKIDTLMDPLNNKYLYSNGCREDSLNDKSKHVLLTKEYGIEKVKVNCNTTSTIGQISFGYDGKIYSQLGTNIKEILTPCEIKLFNDKNDFTTIRVEPKTGYIHKI
jgi:hypothetical protein